MAELTLPDLGEGLTEARVLRWLVAVGDEVVIDQPVVEVETAKAVVEIPIPYAGVVTRIAVPEGETATVGQLLIQVEPVAGEDAVAASSKEDTDGGRVLVGFGVPDEPARRRRRASSAKRPGTATRGVISPVVRRLARDAGIALEDVVPQDGEVICRVDVERAIAARHAALAPADEPAAEPAGAPAADRAETRGVRRIPLAGARGFAADKLSRSRREIPEATVWVDVDATAFLEALAALRSTEHPLSVLALLSRFAIAGLRRFPELNACVADGVISQYDAINLGFAAQTERGLVVPVVQGAGAMSLAELDEALSRRTEQARDGRLPPEALRGGTFTVNNYGVFGVDGSAAIINHPEVAILGIGRIIDRPWVLDGTLAVRKVAQLTLAFDHRVCDGAVAGGFLRYVADCVEAPARLLLDL
ncbi:dihydrolipoamide acetyltransferase family protein [Cumulibacter manganitolerans]|uniref:dihydrolipoamide acetyltransferase family protein n=1 Tax=Cumulibacter manganitolerans TaxID=1884992 RepID=UPI001295CB86|nr:dihydrolipoamide acetyltransferase family protein [Cumulibacter manganitolerans]